MATTGIIRLIVNETFNLLIENLDVVYNNGEDILPA